jgi:hypothetical protein
MWEWVGLLMLKVLMGASFHLILNNKRKKKMRKFDEFTSDVKTDLLEAYVSFAKGEIAEIGNPTNLPLFEIAKSYDWTFNTTIADFELFVNPITVIAWTGPRQPHMPR